MGRRALNPRNIHILTCIRPLHWLRLSCIFLVSMCFIRWGKTRQKTQIYFSSWPSRYVLISPTQQTKTDSTQLAFLSLIFWAVAVTLIRSSIILLYIRIFPARSFRFTCYAVLTLNAAFSIGAILTDCLICLPIACNWDFSTSCSSCGDQRIFELINAVFNLLLDITVVVLPMPLLWGLQMPVSKKVILSGMFGLGTA